MEKNVFTFSKEGNKEYSASIVRIGDLIPIEGSDFLVKTVVEGEDIVVRKDEVKTGDIMIYARIELQDKYNELPLYVNQGLHSSEQYAAIVSHDDFENSFNPYLNRDHNIFFAEYGYLMDNPVHSNIVYFCRPEDTMWKTDNIRYINARR